MTCSSPTWLALTGKRGGCVILDEADLRIVEGRTWYHSGVGYAVSDSRVTGRHYMHRLLLGSPSGLQVDHINGNPLDNRRQNLRAIEGRLNQRNMHSSKNVKAGGFKGVRWDAANRKWAASITANRKSIWCGRHPSAEAAARAYDTKARELFGDMAALNFPEAK